MEAGLSLGLGFLGDFLPGACSKHLRCAGVKSCSLDEGRLFFLWLNFLCCSMRCPPLPILPENSGMCFAPAVRELCGNCYGDEKYIQGAGNSHQEDIERNKGKAIMAKCCLQLGGLAVSALVSIAHAS